jgi:agmatinase
MGGMNRTALPLVRCALNPDAARAIEYSGDTADADNMQGGVQMSDQSSSTWWLNPPRVVTDGNIGPVDSSVVPRFSGPATFALLPRLDEVDRADIAVLGAPFDAGVSYRPGARFGPAHVRQSSRLLRPYNPSQDVSPFADAQVVDAGDVPLNPFDIGAAIDTLEKASRILADNGTRILTIGGDHTIALPLLRTVAAIHGPVALLHFDAHLDTWDTYFGAAYTHGTPFRRAVEEGIVDVTALSHIGTRGPLYGRKDLEDDKRFGFGIFSSADVYRLGVDEVVAQLLARVGDRPLYVSIDIDVLDPAHAPGTGTPEAGGITSRELLEILRGLSPLNLVGADIVEVSPAYDHAELTGVAASHVGFELLTWLAIQHTKNTAAATTP